jgi:hypothetical protein
MTEEAVINLFDQIEVVTHSSYAALRASVISTIRSPAQRQFAVIESRLQNPHPA